MVQSTKKMDKWLNVVVIKRERTWTFIFMLFALSLPGARIRIMCLNVCVCVWKWFWLTISVCFVCTNMHFAIVAFSVHPRVEQQMIALFFLPFAFSSRFPCNICFVCGAWATQESNQILTAHSIQMHAHDGERKRERKSAMRNELKTISFVLQTRRSSPKENVKKCEIQ